MNRKARIRNRGGLLANSLIGLARRCVRRVRFARFLLHAPGRIRVGRDFIIGPRPVIARGVRFHAGDRVNIAGEFVMHVNLTIGDDVMISSRVAFIGNDHSFDDPAKTIQDQDRLPASCAKLEGDNLIGFGTIVIGDVKIGRGTIVGAGSVVTRDLPENSICVGIPAAPIKKRR